MLLRVLVRIKIVKIIKKIGREFIHNICNQPKHPKHWVIHDGVQSFVDGTVTKRVGDDFCDLILVILQASFIK